MKSAQAARVARVLLAAIGKSPDLWTSEDPTDAAFRLRDEGVLSAGEQIILLLAFEISDHSTSLMVSDLFRLDKRLSELATSLLSAKHAGDTAVDAWIRLHTTTPLHTN